ncbi:MAG: hypothetical protein ICV60_07795 [Pyrinomonadaceae bacterium]|nr:hypothetical protein [Pyrinomonadaceae bacterium]
MEPQPPQSIEVFYSYAREDEQLRDELRKHLGDQSGIAITLHQLGRIA